MKNLLFCLSLCLFATNALAQTTIEWEKSFGGTSTETGLHIINTPDGGYLVGSVTNSNNVDVSGNHGTTDMWLTKLNSDGVLEWQKCLGGLDVDALLGMDNSTSGGYILAGHTWSNGPKNSSQVYGNHGAQDFWVVKVDEIGQIEWRNCYGGCDAEEVRGIRQVSDGSYVVVGGTLSVNTGDVYIGHGNWDAWILKIARDGALLWQRAVGGSGKDYYYAIEETSNGDLLAVGVSSSSDGDLSGNINKGGEDLMITQLTTDGDFLWSKTYGGSDDDGARALCLGTDGNIFVTGNTSSYDGDVTDQHGGKDVWVLRLDASGGLLWQKTYGGSQNETGFSILSRTDNDFILCGETTSYDGDVVDHHIGNDGWVLKFDQDGMLKTSICLGGSNDDHARAVVAGTGNSIIVGATAASSDGDVSVNYGSSDTWVVKLSVPLGLKPEAPTADALELKITPNPANDLLKIATNVAGFKQVDVFDENGKLLQSLEMDQFEKSLQINTLPAGIYMVRVLTASGQILRGQFVKA